MMRPRRPISLTRHGWAVAGYTSFTAATSHRWRAWRQDSAQPGELICRHEQRGHACREGAREVFINDAVPDSARRLDQHEPPRPDLAGNPGGDAVARDLPRVRQ